MAAIDVGAAAIDRATFTNNYTIIDKNNPANLSGKITSVEIWADSILTNCKVAIFYEGVANTFTVRDWEVIATVAAGSKQTKAVDLDVVAGDYIGIYTAAGDDIEIDGSGAGWWSLLGDYIPCADQLFAFTADRSMSVYGIGAEIIGWTGKISGITNPAKVMGVDVANIAKVKGIA